MLEKALYRLTVATLKHKRATLRCQRMAAEIAKLRDDVAVHAKRAGDAERARMAMLEEKHGSALIQVDMSIPGPLVPWKFYSEGAKGAHLPVTDRAMYQVLLGKTPDCAFSVKLRLDASMYDGRLHNALTLMRAEIVSDMADCFAKALASLQRMKERMGT